MTTTDIVVAPKARGALALQGEQTWWDDRQMAALQQMGVRNASAGDLVVFLHVSQKTGLDPFARQIYMIERAGKQTIQTGIDGFRLIARRSADRLGETLEYEDTLWADDHGNWTDVWLKSNPPAAAKVTVLRNGRRFSAVALFREYAQTNRDGVPTAMWGRMPANQIAKCAEALALRKAYPQDLSGIYTDDEMGQAERGPAGGRPAPAATDGPAAQRMAAVLDDTEPSASRPPSEPTPEHPIVDVVPEPDDAPGDQQPAGDSAPRLDMRSSLAKGMFAILGEAGIPEENHHAYLTKLLDREITSRKDLTEADARTVIDATRAALDEPFPSEGQQ